MVKKIMDIREYCDVNWTLCDVQNVSVWFSDVLLSRKDNKPLRSVVASSKHMSDYVSVDGVCVYNGSEKKGGFAHLHYRWMDDAFQRLHVGAHEYAHGVRSHCSDFNTDELSVEEEELIADIAACAALIKADCDTSEYAFEDLSSHVMGYTSFTDKAFMAADKALSQMGLELSAVNFLDCIARACMCPDFIWVLEAQIEEGYIKDVDIISFVDYLKSLDEFSIEEE